MDAVFNFIKEYWLVIITTSPFWITAIYWLLRLLDFLIYYFTDKSIDNKKRIHDIQSLIIFAFILLTIGFIIFSVQSTLAPVVNSTYGRSILILLCLLAVFIFNCFRSGFLETLKYTFYIIAFFGLMFLLVGGASMIQTFIYERTGVLITSTLLVYSILFLIIGALIINIVPAYLKSKIKR